MKPRPEGYPLVEVFYSSLSTFPCLGYRRSTYITRTATADAFEPCPLISPLLCPRKNVLNKSPVDIGRALAKKEKSETAARYANSFSKEAIFTHRQNTYSAVFNSSSGGKLGASLILLSSGSIP